MVDSIVFIFQNILNSKPLLHTHFNTLNKKALGKHCGKRRNCSNEQFHLLPQCFAMKSVSENPLIATVQLSSAASLNLGRSQNGVFGNGLKKFFFSGCQKFIAKKKKVFVFVRTDFFLRLQNGFQVISVETGMKHCLADLSSL